MRQLPTKLTRALILAVVGSQATRSGSTRGSSTPRVWSEGSSKAPMLTPSMVPYETIYTISNDPPLAWNEIRVDLKDYRYLRYRGSTESFGNVAEIEFYRDSVKL